MCGEAFASPLLGVVAIISTAQLLALGNVKNAERHV